MCAATAWWFIVLESGLLSMALRAAKFEVAACAPMEARCNYC